MSRVMQQGDFRPMAKNREAMADLVAILDARAPDYARAQAELDTSGDTIERSSAKLLQIVKRCLAAPPASLPARQNIAGSAFANDDSR
jgi:XRE family aerobic/anaerobic benzoate catabolism transcriptional regulator